MESVHFSDMFFTRIRTLVAITIAVEVAIAIIHLARAELVA